MPFLHRARLLRLVILPASCLLFIQVAVVAGVNGPGASGLNLQFRLAVRLYQNQQFAQAEQILKQLVRSAPNDFQVNELMGLVCSAQQKAEEATAYLTKAVRLKPDSAEARTELGANLMGLHRTALAERQFRKAAALDPGGYDANHNLGEFYIEAGKLSAAVPYLAKAQSLEPSSYNNGYDLALAEVKTGGAPAARITVQRLLAVRNTAELHSLLATADEQAGRYLEAASEYQLAAHMDPSEANIFAWGSELLVHHTLEPAVKVFSSGAAQYPRSARMQVGLGIALYSRTHYADAIDAFCRAIDLNPVDTRPYMFLGKIYDVSPLQAAAVTERFARYAKLQPHNPQALYYYAMSLWKASRIENKPVDLQKVETLLETAIAARPAFAQAHLQLGIFYAQQRRFANAIVQYRQAIQMQPDLADARYHLAEALVRIGQRAEGRQEFATFNRLHEGQVKEREKQRRQVLQFVYTANPPAKTSQ